MKDQKQLKTDKDFIRKSDTIRLGKRKAAIAVDDAISRALEKDRD